MAARRIESRESETGLDGCCAILALLAIVAGTGVCIWSLELAKIIRGGA